MTTLKEQLAFARSECVETGGVDRAFVEFQPKPGLRHGFAIGQLLNYSLQPETELLPDAPPERLTLEFSTADVVIFGARLAKITELICEHKLAAVRPLASRYSELHPQHPWVAEILIRRIDKSGSAVG
jgi:hypothetical protein